MSFMMMMSVEGHALDEVKGHHLQLTKGQISIFPSRVTRMLFGPWSFETRALMKPNIGLSSAGL